MSGSSHFADDGRPHCQRRAACAAKTAGKHCNPCASASPEVRARKSAGIRKRLAANPAEREARAARAVALSKDPAIVARRGESARRIMADPEVKKRHRAACIVAKARLMQDPLYVEKLRQAGREVGSLNIQHAWSPEAKERSRLAIKAKHLAWCPPEHWQLNADLKRKGIRLPERKLIIAAEIDRASPAAAARRAIAELDRQQRARHARELAQAY